jgi:hypothetical protein
MAKWAKAFLLLKLSPPFFFVFGKKKFRETKLKEKGF